jgi:hypothetical protein
VKLRFLPASEAELLHETVKGFPFSIFYRYSETEVLVLAVAADSKRPGYWLSRTE